MQFLCFVDQFVYIALLVVIRRQVFKAYITLRVDFSHTYWILDIVHLSIGWMYNLKFLLELANDLGIGWN